MAAEAGYPPPPNWLRPLIPAAGRPSSSRSFALPRRRASVEHHACRGTRRNSQRGRLHPDDAPGPLSGSVVMPLLSYLAGGAYQMGEDQARSWIVSGHVPRDIGRPFSNRVIGRPARRRYFQHTNVVSGRLQSGSKSGSVQTAAQLGVADIVGVGGLLHIDCIAHRRQFARRRHPALRSSDQARS